MSSPIPSSPFLGGTLRVLVALVVLGAVVTHLAAGPGALLWGLLAGGAIAIGNFGAIVWLGGRLVAADQRSKVLLALLFMVKLLLLFGLVAVALLTLPVDPLAFAFGCVLVVPAALLMLLWQSLRPALATPPSSEQSA